MKLLVSFCNIDRLTRSSVKRSPLCLIDITTHQLIGLTIPFIPDSIGITGLTQDTEYIYAAYQSHRPGVIVLSKRGLGVRDVVVLDGISDTHSLYIKNQYLYVVSTGNDSIVRYAVHGGKINKKSRQVIWKPVGSQGKINTHHVNSIVSCKGRLIASAFGPKKGTFRSSATNGYIIDIKNNRRIIHGIYHPHSISVADDTVYYCESATKTVFENHIPLLKFTDGYVRGLTKQRDTVMVGLSSFRTTSKSTGLAVNPFDLGGSLHTTCRLVVADFAAARASAPPDIYAYDLSRFYTEIYDIIVLAADVSLHSKNIQARHHLKRVQNKSLIDDSIYSLTSPRKRNHWDGLMALLRKR